jgi:hypothetical protein
VRCVQHFSQNRRGDCVTQASCLIRRARFQRALLSQQDACLDRTTRMVVLQSFRRTSGYRRHGKRQSRIFASSRSAISLLVIPSEVENGGAGKPRHGREGQRLRERDVNGSNPATVLHGNATGSFDFGCAALRMTMTGPRGNSPQRIPPDPVENTFAAGHTVLDDTCAARVVAQKMLLPKRRKTRRD